MGYPGRRPLYDITANGIAEHAALIDISDYSRPERPAEHILRQTLTRVKRAVGMQSTRIAVAGEDLQAADSDWLDRVAPEPASGPLKEDLFAALDQWVESSDARRIRTVLMPPAEQQGLLANWAADRGHDLLKPQARARILESSDFEPRILGGDGVVVIEDLAHWFVRHWSGLDTGRSLLRWLSCTERRCVVGCNSWAWPWLNRAAAVDLQLPEPKTFAPYDALRLREWFASMSQKVSGGRAKFRDYGSGKDVLALQEDDALDSHYLEEIAARSLGVPWIAWHLWREGMRAASDTGNDEESNDRRSKPSAKDSSEKTIDDAPASHADDAGQERSTVWLVSAAEYELPGGHESDARLVMHSILLHGGLAADELAMTLPGTRAAGLLTALLERRALVDIRGQLHCAPALYPDMRHALFTAGYPVGLF